MRLRALILLLSLALVSGCLSHATGLRGIAILDGASCAKTGVPRGSVAQEAAVTLRCPDEDVPRATATTDHAGRFFIELDDALPPGCRIEVHKYGYFARHFAVDALCAQPDGEGCEAASIVAELPPRPEPTGSDSAEGAAP